MQDKVNGNGNGKPNPLLVALISAVLASGSTIGVVFNTPVGQGLARPDPYTGTQAASLEARVNYIEKSVTGHIIAHPDEVNQFDRRIATLEAQYSIILANQNRIIEKLDKR